MILNITISLFIGVKYNKKKSDGSKTVTQKKDKLALIKGDLIEYEENAEIEFEEESNETSSSNNKLSNLNNLYAELLGMFYPLKCNFLLKDCSKS